uniref:ATP synthase mitochondrial F1 complex assembly factor 1 n=1 Tax=Mucochytrium quahogii TaxID=96639 RepID=A0A7S2RS63_9STRA|mmetsp:Transcript_18967/g.30998  ORF Transcript_18967/g.30998 Transcript_18967/m.30998 type:complete len:248 (+) Transcript_18967:34-777(+)
MLGVVRHGVAFRRGPVGAVLAAVGRGSRSMQVAGCRSLGGVQPWGAARGFCTDKPPTTRVPFDEEKIKQQMQPLIPKQLKDLVKMELFKDMSKEDIEQVWEGYHETRKDSTSTVLSSAEWEKLKSRTKLCPLFVHPVVKSDTQFYVLLSQWNDNHNLMTFLEDYQKDPKNALPYLYTVAYTDFAEEKDVVLVRAEFLPYLTKEEAKHLLAESLKFYVHDDASFEHVSTFNLNSPAFDFNAVFKLPVN